MFTTTWSLKSLYDGIYAGRYSTGLVFIKVQSDLMFAFNGLNILQPKTPAGKKKVAEGVESWTVF